MDKINKKCEEFFTLDYECEVMFLNEHSICLLVDQYNNPMKIDADDIFCDDYRDMWFEFLDIKI